MKQKKVITVTCYEENEEDCSRTTYVTYVNGKEYMLAPCCLSWSEKIEKEIRDAVTRHFGADTEIRYDLWNAWGCLCDSRETE